MERLAKTSELIDPNSNQVKDISDSISVFHETENILRTPSIGSAKGVLLLVLCSAQNVRSVWYSVVIVFTKQTSILPSTTRSARSPRSPTKPGGKEVVVILGVL